MGKVLGRFASTLTILAIAMSSLVVGSPAANAAGYTPPKPTCNRYLAGFSAPWDLGNRASCQAKSMWEMLDVSANQMRRENNATVRTKVNFKYYWAVAAPLASGANNSSYWKQAFAVSSSKAGTAASSKESSYRFLISLRNFVARNSKNYTLMNSSVLTLNAINKLTIGKNIGNLAPAVTRNVVKYGFKFTNVQTPVQVLAAAAIPLVKDNTLNRARNDLFVNLWI